MAQKKPKMQNRRARFDYDLTDEFTAGLVLHGFEAKSIRAGHIDLNNAFVTIKDGEAWLINAHVRRYNQAASLESYDPTRPRKLLLHQRELDALIAAKQQKLTIVPLAVLTGPYIKLRLATGRGKKKYDKREILRRRDMEREADRTVKRRVS